jgi:hypothetical protein
VNGFFRHRNQLVDARMAFIQTELTASDAASGTTEDAPWDSGEAFSRGGSNAGIAWGRPTCEAAVSV